MPIDTCGTKIIYESQPRPKMELIANIRKSANIKWEIMRVSQAEMENYDSQPIKKEKS